jgi:hypothetical protein
MHEALGLISGTSKNKTKQKNRSEENTSLFLKKEIDTEIFTNEGHHV